MNNKASYELIITSKLESIPVPDLCDAIWARIEAQLDNDLPTDDSGGDSPMPGGPSLTRKILTGMGIMTATVALISLIYFADEQTDASIKSEQQNIPATTIQPNPATTPAPVDKPKSQSTTNAVRTETSEPLPEEPVPVPRTAIQPGVPLTDSSSIGRPSIKGPPFALPNLRPADTLPRKTVGVPDISDDDYKIEPKKNDTTN